MIDKNKKNRVVMGFSDMLNDDNDMFPFPLSGDSSKDDNDLELPEILPILPIRNMVQFPGVVTPIVVGRKKSLKLVRENYDDSKLIGVITQKVAEIESPTAEDFHPIGTVSVIMKILEMPDTTTSTIIQGKKRFIIEEIIGEEPYFKAKVRYIDCISADESKEFEAMIGSLRSLAIKIIKLSGNLPQEATFAIKNIDDQDYLINYIAANSELNTEEKQELLSLDSMYVRAEKLLQYLIREEQRLELQHDIQSKVRNDIEQQQREYLLNQQIKTLQTELGGTPSDLDVKELSKKAKKKKWTKEIKTHFDKELKKLERMNPMAPEYSTQLTYLQNLTELPWSEVSKDNFDLKRAIKVLDKDHYGLEKVKERILEHLAVLKLKGNLKAPILCLYGPPGVGKTSLGKSVAKALNRKYVRMSLGGLHDESEIRGHRRTYIGAMPGRILQNLKKVKTSNPVFVLDEIDKIGNDFRGDPASALLEVLDPEQNTTFYDNYLELEYDLSNVLFIATANTLNPIQSALKDRMEMINVTGYIVEEKVEIAKRHIIPKLLENHGLAKKDLSINKKVLEHVVEFYTREAGVRSLEKQLATLIRRIAKKIALEEEYNKNVTVAEVKTLLGTPPFSRDKYENNRYAGVVTGLAWTAVGGEVLFVESSLSKGNGKLTITGNLGDVMKESTVIALEYVKSHATELNINPEIFDNWNIHLHVPEGAIPKDGPSAGITMATSLASVFTQRKVKKHLAMTGEITLRGKLLPVGGIKEKILAAKRADIKEIILSVENKKDVEEIKDMYLEGLTFHFIEEVMQGLEIALLPEKVDKPLVLETIKD